MLAEINSASNGPLWYLIVAPISIAVTLFGLWLSQKGERRKRAESDRRLHDAMFGYGEGTTKVPGIFEIVVGDGNGGSLSAISKATRSAANNAVVATSETKRKIDDLTTVVADHIADDRQIWSDLGTSLESLASGQAAAAKTAAHVANALQTKGTPAKKVTPAKRAVKKRP